MMRVKAMAAVKTLFLILFTKHIKAHTEYYLPDDNMPHNVANNKCTLATPVVHIEEFGYTVDINPDGITFPKDEIILTGYSEAFQDFQYAGCNHATTDEPSRKFPNRGNIGMCYFACKTRYIGIGVEKAKRTCYCYNTGPKLERKDRCTIPCDGNKLCGGYGFVSIYKKVEEYVERAGNNTCLAYYPLGYTYSGPKWTNCEKELWIACQDEDNMADPNGLHRASWEEAMQYCFEEDDYPITKTPVLRTELTKGMWTGQIRSRVVLATSQNPTGYLKKTHGGNSTFRLKFGASNKIGRPLCVKDLSSSTGFTDVDTYSVTDRKSILRTDIVTSSVTESEAIYNTDATPNSALTGDGKDENGKDVIFIIIPVLAVAVVVIAILLLRRRKRKTETARRDTEGYRQVSFRSNQRTRTVTNQVYAAEGFHQAPDDSVQNTYHILEPTYEQVDVEDLCNDRHSLCASNDYHILEPRYEQPGVVEFSGDLDGISSSDVANQLAQGSTFGEVYVEEQPNDRHSKEAGRDNHIPEPTYEIPDVVESHEHLNGNSSIKVVCQLASGSSYEQVDVCAGATEQVDERTVQGGANKLEPVRNNVDPFDIYNHSSTTGVDDYDTTASVIGKRQTTFPVTDDVYNRLGDGDTYNVLKKY